MIFKSALEIKFGDVCMFCCGHSHHELKDGIDKLVNFGIDTKLIPSLIHSESPLPFPDAKSDDEYLSKYILATESLTLTNINDLEIKGLNLFSELKSLAFISCTFRDSIDFKKLLTYPKLTDLLFCDCEINNFDELLIFKDKLEGFEFSAMKSSIYSILKLLTTFPKLKRLALCDNTLDGSELTCLKELTELEELNLDDNCIKSFKYINSLKRLKSLSIDNNFLTSIKDLNLKNLEEIQLSNNELKSLASLSYLKNLTYIAANNNKIDTVNDLSSVDSLLCVELANNPFTDRNIKEELLDVEFVVAFE